MYNQDNKMYAALRRFDWEAVTAFLDAGTAKTLRHLLTDINRSGCLIRFHEIPAEEEHLREQFIEQIKEFTSRIGGPSAATALNHILRQAELTELALAEIDATFSSDEFSEKWPATQAWAILTHSGASLISLSSPWNDSFVNEIGSATLLQ